MLRAGAPARFRDEVRSTVCLAAPLIGGHLAIGLIGLVEAIVAGRHGTTTLAALSIGVSIVFLAKLLPMGTLLALSSAVARLNGAGRRSEVGHLFQQALWLAALLGFALFALVTGAVHALEPMGIAPEILPGAAAYLRGARWGMPALTLYYAMRQLSNGLHWTLPAMVLGVCGLVVSIPLSYCLTFGFLGLPERGPGGLGTAWALTVWIQVIAFTTYLTTSKRFASLGLFAGFFTRSNFPHWEPMGELLRSGLPVGMMVMMEGGLFMVTALLIGQIGAAPSAAHQIAISVASICYMIPFGLAEVTAVRIGHAAGSGDGPLAVRRAALVGLTLVLLTQTLSGLTLLIGRDSIAALYSRDEAVAAIASSLLVLAALFQLPDGIQTLFAGALRGLRDTRVTMLLVAVAYWCIGMPLAAGLALGLGRGPQGMWIGLIAGLVAAAALLAARFIWSSSPERSSR